MGKRRGYRNYSGRKEWDSSECRRTRRDSRWARIQASKGYVDHHKPKVIYSQSVVENTELGRPLSNLELNAKRMRERPTKAELYIKRVLLDLGVEFLNQHIIGYRILDFYLPKQRIAIEADGAQHFTPEGIEADDIREREIKKNDPRIQFIRYSNQYVINIKSFKDRLNEKIIELTEYAKTSRAGMYGAD